MPVGAAKTAFQFLDNFTVPAYWAVKPLQIAVDDKNEVIEIFTGGK